jgi:hypothetical protein
VLAFFPVDGLDDLTGSRMRYIQMSRPFTGESDDTRNPKGKTIHRVDGLVLWVSRVGVPPGRWSRPSGFLVLFFPGSRDWARVPKFKTIPRFSPDRTCPGANSGPGHTSPTVSG